MKVLSRFGKVEWGRFSVGIDPFDGLAYPPLVVWRYSIPLESVADIFRSACRDVGGSEFWQFDSGSRNWSLMPRRMAQDFAAEETLPQSAEILRLKAGDQNFCRMANRELSRCMRLVAQLGGIE